MIFQETTHNKKIGKLIELLRGTCGVYSKKETRSVTGITIKAKGIRRFYKPQENSVLNQDEGFETGLEQSW